MKEKRLASNNAIVTISTNVERGTNVDATAKKLTERLRELERTKWEVDSEIQAIQKALEVAGVRPDFDWTVDIQEPKYAKEQPFRHATLPEACEQILKDHSGAWLSMAQIEYLVTRGGYQFNTENTKNSVGVTLQRMLGDGKIEAKRTRGSGGNRYCWLPEKKEEAS